MSAALSMLLSESYAMRGRQACRGQQHHAQDPRRTSRARSRYAVEHNQWPTKTTNEKTVTRHSWRLWICRLSRSSNRPETACRLHIHATAGAAAPRDASSESPLHACCARVRFRPREHTVAGRGNCRASGPRRRLAVRVSAIVCGRVFVSLADRLWPESDLACRSTKPWDGR